MMLFFDIIENYMEKSLIIFSRFMMVGQGLFHFPPVLVHEEQNYNYSAIQKQNLSLLSEPCYNNESQINCF